MRQTLYRYKDADISIDIDSFFDNGNLVVEGYDIGKTVEEFWGDSDYEYSTTVEALELNKLYSLLEVPMDEGALLAALARKFNTNSCYSEYQAFLGKHGIRYKGFSWM